MCQSLSFICSKTDKSPLNIRGFWYWLLDMHFCLAHFSVMNFRLHFRSMHFSLDAFFAIIFGYTYLAINFFADNTLAKHDQLTCSKIRKILTYWEQIYTPQSAHSSPIHFPYRLVKLPNFLCSTYLLLLAKYFRDNLGVCQNFANKKLFKYSC